MSEFFTVTVSQVTRRLSMLVKGDKALSDVYVAGEISNFTLHKASGHMYFTLKDETSSIKCVMFAGKAAGHKACKHHNRKPPAFFPQL